MRVALLADIHANDHALAAVLAAVRAEGIDELMVCGDLVGYYFAAERVMDLLRPWKKHMVRGNHEDMLALAHGNPGALAKIDGDYGTGIRLALERLAPQDLEALLALPATASVELGGFRILLCHGSPWDTNFYVFPDAAADTLRRCAVREYDAVVMGHTHYPMLHEVDGIRLVNPGSVGQPRNRRPGADWAVLDTDSGEIDLRHETYDVAALVAETRERAPHLPYLHEVLVRQ